MAKKIDLSVVIPAYKEIDNFNTGVLSEIHNYLKNQKYTYEVLIVDDGSPDDTAKVAANITKNWKNFKVLKEPHRGKGGTVIAGVMKAKGDIILFTDADQSTPLCEIEKFFPKFEEGYDIVIGSRSNRKGAPILRKIMATGFVIVRTIILRLPYKDTQCGFKAFSSDSKKVFKKMKVFGNNSKSTGVTAGFDLELLYLARKNGYKVAEVPINWQHKGTERVNALRDSIQAIRDLLKIRINSLMGVYK